MIVNFGVMNTGVKALGSYIKGQVIGQVTGIISYCLLSRSKVLVPGINSANQLNPKSKADKVILIKIGA